MAQHAGTWRLIDVTPATGLAVSLADAKSHGGDIPDSDDALLTSYIEAATEWVEAETGRQLLNATYTALLDCFPDRESMVVPCLPLVSVDSVKYIDGDGVEQTIADTVYTVQDYGTRRLSRVGLASGQAWPSHRVEPDAVRVTFTAGYGGSIPAMIQTTIKQYAREMYDFGNPDTEKLALWLKPFVVHRWA